MADLVLYHAVPSRSMIVHWMLEELGEPFELEILDMQAEEHKTAEYLALNPMGKVPTLRHGNTIVTESAAICAYLADAFPEAGLGIPADSPLRGPYLRWLFFAPVTAEPAILWKSLGKVTTEIDYLPFADIETVAETLRGAVSGRKFIVGDHFTAADVMIGSTIMWGLKLAPVLPELPELLTYWEQLEARPAWQKSNTADQQLLTSGTRP
jgi:glutathione S-transferase